MKLKPLGDRLIVRAIEEEETTASGIVLPDTAKEKPQKGEVIAVGDGRYDDEGEKRIPLDVATATPSSTRSTAARRSRSTARTCWSCARATSSPRSRRKEKQMAHKELKYDIEARNALQSGRRRRGQRGQGDARAQGPLRRPRQEVRRPHHHERRRDHRP
jgi:hypothetical protein